MTSDPSDSPAPGSDSDRSTGTPAISTGSRMVDGERRIITILFCDVVSSTSLAGQLDPEEWAEVMNEAFQYMIAPIQEYEGLVARLMGDAVLAFFGAPQAHEDDPQRAVLAGLGILSGMRPFIKQFREEYGLDFDVRVGINTGPVVVGEIGSNMLQEYTAMGDAINLAARMEQTALPGTVQISEDTYRLVAPIFDVYDLGLIEVKGKDEPVPAYRVLDVLPGPGRLRGIEGLETKLVGRDREMARLTESMSGLADSKSRIVFVLGEAGLGKSRLIAELRSKWRAELHNLYTEKPPLWNGWTEFVAVSYGTSRPYDMLKRQLRKYYTIRETDAPAVVEERLKALVTLYPEALQQRIRRYFGFLLGNTLPESGPLPEGESFKRELRAILTEAAAFQADQGPIVYVIDDLHWADPASIDALHDLLTLVTSRPILFLLALRPDWNSLGWQLFINTQLEFPDQCVSIFLEPLSGEDSRALIAELLGTKAPPRLVDAIQQKAEGNPLFIEEVARALYDNGIVTRTAEGPEWLSEADEQQLLKLISLPGNVQALLTARIDRLPAEARRTLQMASVIGRTFPQRVLEKLMGSGTDVGMEIQALIGADLIRPAGDVVDDFTFLHALARDAAYETILLRQRRRYHRQVGEAIEAVYPDRLDEEAPRLAYHYAEARDWAHAIHYYTIAGESAAKIYAQTEAIEHFSRAIDLALATPQAITDEALMELFLRRGRIYELEGLYDEALRSYEALEALGQERGNPTMELAALSPQIIIYATPNFRMDATRGTDRANRTLELARQLGSAEAEARAYWGLLLLYLNADINPNKAVENGEKALALARTHHLDEIEAYVLNDIARAYGISGRVDDSLDSISESQVRWRKLGNDTMLADALGIGSQGLLLTGHPAEAGEKAREGLAVAHRIGSNWGIAFNSFALGYALLEQGRIDEAHDLLRQSVEMAELAHFQGPGAMIPILLSWTYGHLGAPEYHREELAGWLDEAIDSEDTRSMHTLWDAMTLHFAGQNAPAAALVDNITVNELVVDGTERLLGVRLAPDILLADGQYEAALQLVDNYLVLKNRLGLGAFIVEHHHYRGLALHGLGRDDEALQSLTEALSAAESQGIHSMKWRLLGDLVELDPDPEKKARYRAEAADEIEHLLSNMADPTLHEAFLALPRVRWLRESA